MKHIAILGAIIISLSVTFAWSAEPDHFRQYLYPLDGFEVAFPQKPLEFRTDRGLDRGHVNSYQAVIINPVSQHSVFISHSPKRVFEDAAKDAYLEGIVRGLTTASDDAVLKYAKRTKFLGFPAIEYQYTHKIEGVPVIGRGIILLVDGDHIRLSQIYATNDNNAENNFKKFVGSFRLMSINGALSKQRFDDRARNIFFSPPDGWKQGTPKFAQVAAIFAEPGGHSITVLDSGTPAYVCDNYKSEIQATQGVQSTGEILARDRPVTWLKSTAHNPAAGIRMTSVHYCVNTTKGAVIMIGAAPEQTFFRSEVMFRNTATTMVVRK
ncbi:MAG: hypothetical protein ABTQ25_14950 [Nitrosomonas ureae]